MSRLRRLLQPVNWKYALGELALIVAGIWIALAATDWNQARHDREAELWALRQIHAALSADLANLQATALEVREKEQRIGVLIDHLRRDAPYADSLDAYFGSLYGFNIARVNSSPYEAVRERGLDLISSDSLRLQLIHLYDHTYVALEVANDLFVNVSLEVLRPYFLAHFRDLRPNENATPLDPPAVVRDPYFENLAEYRRMVLQRSALPAYTSAIEDASRLARAVEREIEQLK